MTSAPPILTPSNSARFLFVGSIAGSVSRCAECSFQCQIDQQAPQPCTQGSATTNGATYRYL